MEAKLIDAFITNIGEEFDFLSQEAKDFFNKHRTDDIERFYNLLVCYQIIIKERFYMEDNDEGDFLTINNIKFLVELLNDVLTSFV